MHISVYVKYFMWKEAEENVIFFIHFIICYVITFVFYFSIFKLGWTFIKFIWNLSIIVKNVNYCSYIMGVLKYLYFNEMSALHIV